jgi:predicted phosphoribosyltransferase
MMYRQERVFADRVEAGRLLGRKVASYLHDLGITDQPLVLGLPRGGLPVAEQVAAAVGGDLDVIVARKIGFPGQPEFGIGAVAEHGPPHFSYGVLRQVGLTEQDLAGEVERERAEVGRRVARYRGDRPPPAVAGRVVVLVDDGLATGVTARAALGGLRAQRPGHLVFAAPVCARDSAAALVDHAEAVLCEQMPADFHAVGAWYADFAQVTDDEVAEILARAWSGAGGRRRS